MKTLWTSITLGLLALSTYADPPKPPAGKVWVLNPLMSDEFGPEGPNPDVFRVYTLERSWDRTSAFDPKVIEAEQDPNDPTNYFLTMNPIWYYADEVWTSATNSRTYEFAGAAMDTPNLQTYGYFEIRIRPSDFPFGSGVFMNSRGNPATVCEEKYNTELDIIENMGYTGPEAGTKDSRGGFFNYVQHVNSHTKNVKTTDGSGNCVGDQWLSARADSYDLDDPHAFFTVGMWWENSTTAHFYNNDRLFSTITPAREYTIPMALILSMETYVTRGNDENNAGNPKPAEWMWEEDFRTKDQRAVKYDWVRTWKLEDIDATNFNDSTDNITTYENIEDVYIGETIKASLLYSASADRTITVSLVSPSNTVIEEQTFNVDQRVAILPVEFSTSSITTASTNYSIQYAIKDGNTVLSSNTSQIAITEKALEKKLYSDGIPTSLAPASFITIDVKYETDEASRIIVEVRKPDDSGISWNSKLVSAGAGTQQFNITPSEALTYGTGYYFRIYMYRDGMDWRDPLAVNLGNLNFDVEDQNAPSISILNLSNIPPTDNSLDVEFSYDTDVNGRLSILLLDKDDNIIASEYRDERYGNRTLTRTMSASSAIPNGSDYKVRTTFTPHNTEFPTITDEVGGITITNNTLGVEKFTKKSITISPNPTTGITQFSLGNNSIESIELYSLTGKVVLEDSAIDSSKYTLDIQNLKNGIYIVKITLASQAIITKKLIKTKAQ